MRPTEPFRAEHEQLVAHIDHLAALAREIPTLSDEEREFTLGRVMDFLRGTLIPHAQAEEAVLYPAWARLVGFPDAAVPMVHDHEAIVERIDRLEHTDVEDTDALQELLYALHALIGVHFRKEEELQLPAFDAAPEVAAEVLEQMGETGAHSH
jgi:iron-sulfur cluster repair protein YtfE (RIC family)